VLLGAVGLLVPTLAAAAWTTPINLSAPLTVSTPAEGAVDADGDAVFVWQRSAGVIGGEIVIESRARSAAGVLSPLQTLTPSGQQASGPDVAVDPAGDAVFAWVSPLGGALRVQTRTRSAAGTLGVTQTLSPNGQNAIQARVAVDADGDAVFVWTRSDGTNDRIQARARSAAGTLSPVQTLSPAGQNAGFPRVAVDPAGDAVFVWTRSDGTNDRIQARARSAAGTLSPVQTLSQGGQDASQPYVGVDTDGDAVVSWERSDGTNARAQARARSGAGTLSPVRTLSASGQSGLDPRVAVDGDGDAVVTWGRFDGTTFRAQARARSAAGTLSPVQNLSDPGERASSPSVAINDGGEAAFAWGRSDVANSRLEARTRSAAGILQPLTVLSPPGVDAVASQVDVDPDGDAVVTWLRFDGTDYRVQASAGP
jgi:hypothetical protein